MAIGVDNDPDTSGNSRSADASDECVFMTIYRADADLIAVGAISSISDIDIVVACVKVIAG